jgi:hypothetical protein
LLKTVRSIDICENKAPVSINVEHFKPHLNKKDLKFDWDNLFWSCAHCNNTKLAKFDGILNCTDSNDDVENKLKYSFNPFPFEKIKIIVNGSDNKTLQTQELLHAVFNGTTTLKEIESANIRNELLDQIQHFQKYLTQYFKDTNDVKEKKRCLRKIKEHLSSASAFTSFKRQIIKDNPILLDKFSIYLTN